MPYRAARNAAAAPAATRPTTANAASRTQSEGVAGVKRRRRAVRKSNGTPGLPLAALNADRRADEKEAVVVPIIPHVRVVSARRARDTGRRSTGFSSSNKGSRERSGTNRWRRTSPGREAAVQ